MYSLTFPIHTMNTMSRKYLQDHIKVKLEKEPTFSSKAGKNWILSGEQKFDLTELKPKMLCQAPCTSSSHYKEIPTLPPE